MLVQDCLLNIKKFKYSRCECDPFCVLQGDTSALKSTNTWPLKQHAPVWLASDDVTAAMSHVRDGGGGLQLFGADCFDVTAGGGAGADAGFQMSNSQSDPHLVLAFTNLPSSNQI